MVEYLLSQNKRVCIVDPKGDWHGIKVGADGQQPGFPVVALGHFKDPRATDVQIHAQAGKAAAELITSGNRPALIGFRGWMPSQMTRFWIDFASTLFNSNAGELYLVIDEVHNFAAKGKILDPLAGQCLHWTNRLMSEGRGNGIVALIASQRPQKVHNDTLTCCETLVTMRAVHQSDRQATADWIDGCGDGKSGREILNTLAGLDRGEAWVWSPASSYGPGRVRFPKFVTLDSFAPPQVQLKVMEKGWATVDLDQIRGKMAEIEAQAVATDPKALKARIRELETALAQAQVRQPEAAEPREVKCPVFSEADAKALAGIDQGLQLLKSSVIGEIEGMRSVVEARLEGATVQLQALRDGILRSLPGNQHGNIQSIPKDLTRPLKLPSSEWGLNAAELTFLSVLASVPGALSRDQLAIFSGYAATSRHVDNVLGSLRSQGYVTGGGQGIVITQAGHDRIKATGGSIHHLIGVELVDHWLSKLPEAEKRMLTFLMKLWPETRTRDQVAVGTCYEPTSRHVDNSLGHLRSLCLIRGGKHAIGAEDAFMLRTGATK